MSNYTVMSNATMNRGVEAKEVEIANARLDVEVSNSTQWTGAREEVHGVDSPDLTGSYLQVVVEKHKRKKEVRRAATSVRLPATSSPAGDGAGARAGRDWPRVLLAYPAPPLTCYVGGAGGGAGGGDVVAAPQSTQVKKNKSWLIFREPKDFLNADADDEDSDVSCAAEEAEAAATAAQPASVEEYRFLRVGARLWSGAARPTRVGARAARWAGGARAAAAEVGAAARLATLAPLLAATLTLRAALHVARDAASALAHALSDYVLKPALAVTYNALLHPLLVFVGNVLRGSLEAARPACAALAEAAGAAAVLLRAVRLVELHYPPPTPTCACRADLSAGHHC